MIDLPWKIFSQTGNIEAYLLMKELEDLNTESASSDYLSEDLTEFDTKM